MNIILKIAKENDFEELQKIQSRAFSLNINFLLEHNKNISLSSPLEIKKKYSNMIFFKIVDDNGIQGGAYVRKLNETTCEIYRIFIDLVMQHHGYGHKIIDGIIDKFQECTKFVLVTPLELSKNLCFYESCGFLSKGLKEENDLKLLIYEKSIERNAVTGLRPSRGGLHLGHWIGNIEPMLLHQNDYNCTFILADLQALNSNKEDYNLKTMYENMHFMLKQLFALGINPNKINIVIESKIKKTMLKEFLQLSNYISLNRVLKLPNFKNKLNKESIKVSTLNYPILQALDLIKTNANIIFSNIDNKANLELINEIFEKNLKIKSVKLITGVTEMLIGIDGKKMCKANNNCIFFTDDNEVIRRKVNSMYTDCNRITIDTPGNLDNNIVFKYLQIFASKDIYEDLSEKYVKGKIGDLETKQILTEILIRKLEEYRASFNQIDDAMVDYYLK